MSLLDLLRLWSWFQPDHPQPPCLDSFSLTALFGTVLPICAPDCSENLLASGAATPSPPPEAVKRSQIAGALAERSREISSGDLSEECTLEVDGGAEGSASGLLSAVFRAADVLHELHYSRLLAATPLHSQHHPEQFRPVGLQIVLNDSE